MDDLISRTFISSPSEMLEKILVLNIFSNSKKMYLVKFATISNVLKHLWMVTIRSYFSIITALLNPIRCSFEKIRSQKTSLIIKKKIRLIKHTFFLYKKNFIRKLLQSPQKPVEKRIQENLQPQMPELQFLKTLIFLRALYFTGAMNYFRKILMGH